MPVPLSATRPRRTDEDERQLEPFSFEALRFKQVVVTASGFTYRGQLVGADESDLYLKGELRWFVLPLDTVSEVREAQAGEGALRTPKPGFDEEGGG